MSAGPDHATRFDRRRAQTRAALVSAAQGLLAEGRSGVPILELTQRADVAIGTFYNHFASKEELYEVAVADALEQYGALFDDLTEDLADPAACFARSFRLTGRLHRVNPQVSRVLLAHAHEMSTSSIGIGPRARRDIAAAHDAGRFVADDIDLAMVVVTGAMVELGHLLLGQPDRDAGATTDAVTLRVLLALGMDRDDATALCAAPLPVVPPLG
jgi:AcrR family transcriptional regulator